MPNSWLHEPEFNRWYAKWTAFDFVRAGISVLAMKTLGLVYGSLAPSLGAIGSGVLGFTTACIAIVIVALVFIIRRKPVAREDRKEPISTVVSSTQPSSPILLERSWPSLSGPQIANLRNRLAAMPPTVEQRDNRHISIAREEFPDCANLADDIAEAFKNAGWVLIDGSPVKIWETIPDGIWIVGPANDPRKPPLLTELSKVLGSDYEPMRLDTAPSRLSGLDEAMTIRIAIGRRPRRN